MSEAEPLIAVLDNFGDRYMTEVAQAILWRLGINSRDPGADRELVQAIERHLRETDTPIDRFFFDYFGGSDIVHELTAYTPRKSRDHPYWSGRPCSMLIDEVEAIWSAIAERDDWSPLHAKVAAIREMGDALA